MKLETLSNLYFILFIVLSISVFYTFYNLGFNFAFGFMCGMLFVSLSNDLDDVKNRIDLSKKDS